MRAFLLLLAAVGIVAAGTYGLAVYREGEAGAALLRRFAPDGAPAESESESVKADAKDDAQSGDITVPVDGAQVRVRISGPEDAPVLLMLHGFSFSLESFDALADLLDERYRVVRYDLLGHGLTGPDPQERYAPGARARFAGEVIRALELDRPVIVGNSLGGLAAWRLEAMEPGTARALVLISPGAFPFNGVTDEPAPIPPGVAFFLRNPAPPLLKASFSSLYADPDLITKERLRIAGERMKGNGDAFVRSIELFTLPDPTADLGKVAAPTLIIWGEEDKLIPAEHGAMIEAAMPDARLVTYPSIGHVAHEEDPERVAADIEAFLAELPEARP
jgi:pimeloyl-ACP methyl ester carboxylesterase